MEQLHNLIPPEKPKAGQDQVHGPERKARTSRSSNSPWKRKTDLVIMAVRGRGALNAAVFGSTTYRVIQLGPCPVLAVHF